MPQIFGVGTGAKKKVLSSNRRNKSKKQQEQEVIDETIVDLPVLKLIIFESLYRT